MAALVPGTADFSGVAQGAQDIKNNQLLRQQQSMQNVTMDNQYGGTLGQLLAGAQGRDTPTATAASAGQTRIDNTQANQSRGELMGLAAMFRDQAAGRGGPSLAQLQMQQGLDSSIAAQRAQAASARGVSPGLAQRLAAQGIAGAQMDVTRQGSLLRAAEQQQAYGALGQLLAGVRSQDQSGAQAQAGLNQQTSLANAGFQQQAGLANQSAELANRAQMDAAASGYLGMGMNREAQQAGMYGGLENIWSQERMNQANINAQQQMAEEARKFNWNQLYGQVAGAGIGGIAQGAGMALASDRRIKEDVKPGHGASKEFLEGLKSYRFKYKGDDTEHLGVMAQDVEKTPGGRGMVREVEGVKMIDVPQALGRLLAASADIHQRLKAVEK